MTNPDSAADRRARLLASKLTAIVREHAPGPDPRPGSFPPGAAAVAGYRAWVLLDTDVDDGTGLGAAIAWSLRNGGAELDLVAEAPLAVAARRGAAFSVPIRVWALDGRELREVAPAPVSRPPAPKPEHLRLASAIEASGATVVVEHGVVTGEVRGLEVCRVVDVDQGVSGVGVRLEVGVGAQDRDAFATIHGDVPTADALAGVVSAVDAARRPEAPGHPLNRLAPERLLRWRLEQEPWLVDVAGVQAAPPPVPRRGLAQRVPCVAVGRRLDGTQVVIVCSAGVDLEVIPYAADARSALGLDGGAAASAPETLVVLPERDALPVTHDLAQRLRHPVSILAL